MKKRMVTIIVLSLIAFISLSLVLNAAEKAPLKKEVQTEKLTPAEKEFMKLHGEDLRIFMVKCSPCHSLERVFVKKDPRRNGMKSSNEWPVCR